MTGPLAFAPPLRLAYSVNDADQRAAIRAIVVAEPQVRWTRVAVAVLPFVMVAWSLSAGWSPGLALFRNVFWIVLAILGVFVYVPWTVQSIVKAIRRADPDWSREQVMTFGQQGIRLESAVETTDIPWSAVQRATETDEVVLIHIGAARVLFLPMRVVAGEVDPATLRRFLRARLGPRASLREGQDR